jgi:monoamine oxidase
VAPYHTFVHALCAELCIPLFDVDRSGDHVYIAPNGSTKRFRGDLPLAPQTAAAASRALSELENIVSEIDVSAPWLHRRAQRLDSQSLEEWLLTQVSDSDAADVVRCEPPPPPHTPPNSPSFF